MSPIDQGSAEPEAVVEIPAHVRRFIARRVPRFKDKPKQFCGREELLQGLEETILETIQAADPEETPPGQIIFAAPGAGKTSVIAELQKRLEKQKKKVSVLRVRPRHIITPKKFNRVILKQSPWKYVKLLKDVGRTFADIIKEPLDGAIGVLLTGALAKMGLPMKVAKLPVFTTVVDHWLAETEPETVDVLELLQHGREGGCVLVIDEAQDMGQYLGNEKHRAHMHEIIETLGIPSSRVDAGVTKGTILMAGLSDTPTIVEQTGSQGIMPMVLPPLPRRHVEEMIANGIDVGAGRDAALAERAKALWLTEIADRYGDWTRHAKAGALAAEDLLKEFKHEVVDVPWGLAALHELGAKYQQEMYRSIVSRTGGDENDRRVSNRIIDFVVWALACNGNRIEQDTMREAIEVGLGALVSPRKFSGPEKEEAAAQERGRVIKRMLRTGLLDRTDHLPHKPDRTPKSYYCPIPSLLDHTLDEIGTSQAAMDEVLAGERLAHGTVTPKAERFRPTWPDGGDSAN